MFFARFCVGTRANELTVSILQPGASAGTIFLSAGSLYLESGQNLWVDDTCCRPIRCLDAPCLKGATCLDTVSGYFCSPVFPFSNFTLVAGAGPGSTKNHPIVSNTTGGQLFSMVVNLGNMTTIQSITYASKTAPLPVSVACAHITTKGLGKGNVRVGCTLTGGVGCNNTFTLTACHPSGVCLSATETMQFCFPPPVIIGDVSSCVSPSASLSCLSQPCVVRCRHCV